MYAWVLSDVSGSTMVAPEISNPPSAAFLLISSSLPMRIILATPSFRILSVASIVLISSVSGSTIVLMLFFALSLSKSTNPMIKWLLSLFRSSDRVSVWNMTSQLNSLYPQNLCISSSWQRDSSKEWYFLTCNFIIFPCRKYALKCFAVFLYKFSVRWYNKK